MGDQESVRTQGELLRAIQSGRKRQISFTNITSRSYEPVEDYSTPQDSFLSDYYQRYNQRRQEHLANLGLNISETSVLEVGAGIGDLTGFFMDRGCEVLSTDARKSNLEILRSRYPDIRVKLLDCDNPDRSFSEVFDVVFCYGVLYHLTQPAGAIEFLSGLCKKLFLLETCVSFGEAELIHPCKEDPNDPTQAISGIGCRPTRNWVYNQLKKHFEFVYLPITQPYFEEFPIDWRSPCSSEMLSRSIFIASREKLNIAVLVDYIPLLQKGVEF